MLREENQENQVIQVWGLEEHRPVIVVICFPENIITHYPQSVCCLWLILSPLVTTFPPTNTENDLVKHLAGSFSLFTLFSDIITCNIPAI